MYYPYQKGQYDVAPGFFPLSKSFGNGEWDQRLFQIGPDFPLYRAQFERNRSLEPASKYVCLAKSTDHAAVGSIVKFLATKLAEEYPLQIKLKEIGADEFSLENDFTGEVIIFFISRNTVKVVRGGFNYESGWDAIGAQLPEDMAIWKMNPDGSEEMEALHLSAPNYWAAEDKVGRSFAVVHAPVAHMEKITPWAVQLLDGILKKGPYVRFAWGVGTDNRLNHHPEPAPNVDSSEWHGRSFDPNQPKLYARVERQVLWGFPELGRAIFTIRTYFQDVAELKKTNPEAVKGLIQAIESMSPQSLVYKGLKDHKENVLRWLAADEELCS